MPFFSKVFKSRDGQPANVKRQQEQQTNGQLQAPPKKRFVSTWNSSEVLPEEVEELIHACTIEMKARSEALDTPFFILPYRPDSDANSSRTFIRNFFKANSEGLPEYRGEMLQQELRLTEPEVLCSIIKWCWSRIPGGVVSWNVYEMFRLGEQDSGMAPNSFDTFVPLSIDSISRKNIVYDFFDLLAAIAARSKANGLGGLKLSRMAGWWAFEHSDNGAGFDGGYKSWKEGADASSHLFFAYLRGLAPEAVNGITGISALPRSLQALVAQTKYPPETPTLMQTTISKVVMIVDSVSPTPFALLRRAKHFEYRAEDRVLQLYSDYADPVQALTEECKRVLNCISSANESAVARSRRSNLTSAQLMNGLAVRSDESWAHFENMGFSAISTDASTRSSSGEFSAPTKASPRVGGLQSTPRSKGLPGGRPTTPSWADFLNSGFADDGTDGGAKKAFVLPPDQILPPLGGVTRKDSSIAGIDDEDLEPGELASITRFDLDDTFWWVWMTSLASEEPAQRKAVFGRCALIETSIMGGSWLTMEEQVKGASPGPEEGAYVVEKKSRFGFSRKGRSTRKRTITKMSNPEPDEPLSRAVTATPNKSSITSDQQAKIKAAASVLAQKQNHLQVDQTPERRGRHDDTMSNRTNSVLTLGLSGEAGPAMQWANAFDKEAVRKQYLGNNFTGKGASREFLTPMISSVSHEGQEPQSSLQRSITPSTQRMDQELPPPPALEEDSKDEGLSAPRAPPALPKVPVVNVQEAQEEVSLAEGTPLPTATPHEDATTQSTQVSPVSTALPMVAAEERDSEAAPVSLPATISSPGRKPLPSSAPAKVHPAFRDPPDDHQSVTPEASGAQIAARSAWHSNAGSSAAATPTKDPKKLLKKSGPGNFKKMFGRKPQEPTVPRPQDKSVSNEGLQSPSESSIGRSLSNMRRKPAPKPLRTSPLEAAQTPMFPDLPINPEGARSPDMARVGSTVPEHLLPVGAFRVPSERAYPPSEMARISHIDSQDQRDADRALSRFDQGPLTDVPAATPQSENYDDDDVTPSVSRNVEQGEDYLHPHGNESQSQSVYATPMEVESSNETGYEPSEGSDGIHQRLSEDPVMPAYASDQWAHIRKNEGGREEAESSDNVVDTSDRWAQIRKNAAERAARPSEDQSRPSHSRSRMTDQTDDGETSGEETIEDRVARIKARVAELTGNMDTRRRN